MDSTADENMPRRSHQQNAEASYDADSRVATSAPSPSDAKVAPAAEEETSSNKPVHNATITKFRPSWQFYTIYTSLCLVTFAAAIDNTIIFTALPTITSDVGGGSQYIWIANTYVIASVAVQPLFGQLSNVLGRRWPSIFVVALFALGSGIAGGATGVPMLLAGRTIQGVGCGGIFVLLDIIVSDLVPLRERGKYLGPLLAAGGLGSALGPLVGGALTRAAWRWVFYITLPFSALALFTMAVFLRTNHVRCPSWKRNLARIDVPGNSLFIASVTAVVLGLSLGDVTFPWSSWRVILPLVLGFAGWILFHAHQRSTWCKEPTIPPRLFGNRTSAVGFALSFLSGLLLEWIVYIYPLYFQALRGDSPFESGINTLPFNACLMPASVVIGVLMSKTGVYRPFHAAAYILLALGLGLTSRLDSHSSTVEWALFQIFLALGLACTFVTILPAIQAALPESDVATATATYSFSRSFGFIWGVTIPSLVLNSRIDQGLYTVSDISVRAQLANGGAYQFASRGAIQALPPTTQQQVVSLYEDTFRVLWFSSLPFAFIGFLLVSLERHIELRRELETEFGLQAEDSRSAGADKTIEEGRAGE